MLTKAAYIRYKYSNIVKILHIKTVFYFNIFKNVNYFCESKADFSAAITPVLNVNRSSQSNAETFILLLICWFFF